MSFVSLRPLLLLALIERSIRRLNLLLTKMMRMRSGVAVRQCALVA